MEYDAKIVWQHDIVKSFLTMATWNSLTLKASGQVQELGGHLENMTSYQKSDSFNRCIFTWRTILPNFIPIRVETEDILGFLKSVASTRTRTRWIAKWNQFLIQKFRQNEKTLRLSNERYCGLCGFESRVCKALCDKLTNQAHRVSLRAGSLGLCGRYDRPLWNRSI